MSRWRSVWPPPAAAIWLPRWFVRVSVRSLAARPRTRGGGGRAAGPEDGHGTPSFRIRPPRGATVLLLCRTPVQESDSITQRSVS